ncbi:SURF1 family protein [Nocardiopsis coralliicola]
MTPRWIGLHLLAVLAVAVCMGAGYWQYLRAQEPDRGSVTSPAQELAAAQPLDEVSSPGAYMPEQEGNTAVRATGTFADTEPLLAAGRNADGEAGFFVIAPLVTGSAGGTDTAVTVARGWIPWSEGEDGVPEDIPPAPEGEVEVAGWLQPPQKDEEGFSPVDLPEGHVARLAPSVLINTWPQQLYEGFIVLGEQAPETGSPFAADAAQTMQPAPAPEPEQGIVWNWKNVSYAAQWAVFGGAVVVFWISLMRRELEDARTEAAAEQDGGGDGPEAGSPVGAGTSAP